MKKSILITALMAIAFSVNAQQVAMRQMVAERPIQQATAEEGSMEYGYCGDLYQYLGMGSATTYRVMINGSDALAPLVSTLPSPERYAFRPASIA